MSLGQAEPRTANAPPRKRAPRLPPEQRREQILDATLRLIVREGFGGVTMEAVAREMDIAKTVVYAAFADQETLLHAVVERAQERAADTLAEVLPEPPFEKEPEEVFLAGLLAAFSAIRGEPDTWRLVLLTADGTPPELRRAMTRGRERVLRRVEPIVAAGLESTPELQALDPELTTHLVVGLAEDAAFLMLTQPRRFSPQRIADYAASVLGVVLRGS